MRPRVAAGVGIAVAAVTALSVVAVVNRDRSEAGPAPELGRVTVAATTVSTEAVSPGTTQPARASTSSSSTSTAPSTTTTTSTTTSTTTTSTTTSTTTTTTTTIAAPTGVSPGGARIPSKTLSLANNLRRAAASGDLDRVGLLLPTKGFRTTFLEDGNDPIEAWREQIATPADPLPRIVRVLGIGPGFDDDGNVVYPYLAVVPPSRWTEADDALALDALGWTPAVLRAAKQKDRYFDDRVVFSPSSDWIAFTNGSGTTG